MNFASSSPALASGGCRDLDFSPDGKIWFALLGYGGAMGGIVRHTPGTSDWHHWTGGNPPQGGNNWPILVWNVNSVSIQPKPGGGYIVWGDADNGASVVSFDSGTQLWTYHEFSYTPGSILDLLGRESVDVVRQSLGAALRRLQRRLGRLLDRLPPDRRDLGHAAPTPQRHGRGRLPRLRRSAGVVDQRRRSRLPLQRRGLARPRSLAGRRVLAPT